MSEEKASRRFCGPSKEKLTDAAALIEEYAATLDISGKMCGECDRMHFNNFGERQQYVELTAMAAKLRRFGG